jgi:hypothetical protein
MLLRKICERDGPQGVMLDHLGEEKSR